MKEEIHFRQELCSMLMKGVASYLEFMILGVVSCSESKAGTSEQKQKWKSEQQKLITLSLIHI